LDLHHHPHQWFIVGITGAGGICSDRVTGIAVIAGIALIRFAVAIRITGVARIGVITRVTLVDKTGF